MDLGVYRIDDYLPIPADTQKFDTGGRFAPSALTYTVYKAGTAIGALTNVDMVPGSPKDSVTGRYLARLQLSAANGFEVGKDYALYITATVNGITAEVPHTFRIEDVLAQSSDIAAAILTNPSNKLNTDANGNVGLNWGSGSVVSDAGNSSTSFKTNLTESSNNHWKDTWLQITSGALLGQVKLVTAYDGTTKIITVSGGFTGTPLAAVTFFLINK